MAVRNCRDIGENLKYVVRRLMANDELCNLLYYTDKDPLSQEPLTEEQKEKFLFNKLIRLVPRLKPTDDAKSVITVLCDRARRMDMNGEFKLIVFHIEVFVPVTQWMIKGDNMRPYAILGQIQESLDGKRINGLGKMTGGEFDFNYVSDEITNFKAAYQIISYD